jgi:hypothetical protein
MTFIQELPQPQPGEALVVERYSARRHSAPGRLRVVQGSSEPLDDWSPLRNGALGVRAHQIAESPEGEFMLGACTSRPAAFRWSTLRGI